MDAMPTAEDRAKTAKATEALAKKHFRDEARIVMVKVEAGDDPDYDPELWIRVVVDTPGGAQLDTDASIRFKSELHDRLREIGITALPIICYELDAAVGEVA